ncbi:MAG: hypothetical protein ACP5N3_06385 [Candidatus Nanoarchaeia archaeon]
MQEKKNLLMIVENGSKHRALVDNVLHHYYNIVTVVDFVAAVSALKQKYDQIFMDLEYISFNTCKPEEKMPQHIKAQYESNHEFIATYLLTHYIRNKGGIANDINLTTPVLLCADNTLKNEKREVDFLNMGATNVVYIPTTIHPFLDILGITIKDLEEKVTKSIDN